jgi:hypothetical protein
VMYAIFENYRGSNYARSVISTETTINRDKQITSVPSQ